MVCAGIDYGSKKAGTTAISFFKNDDEFEILQSLKKKDADRFILKEMEKTHPDIIAIDAPLSVPSGILGKGDQYFYRQCDRVLNAMSPMFLGGLTARAMALKKSLSIILPNVKIYETYPKAYIQQLGSYHLKSHYKQDLTLFIDELNRSLPIINVPRLNNWHQADSFLAYLSAFRIQEGTALAFGIKEEGLIYI